MYTPPLPSVVLPASPRFVAVGCFGEGNGGDEALLTATLAVLRSYYPDGRFLAFSSNPAETAERYGIDALPSEGFLRPRATLGLLRRGILLPILSALKQSDCLVMAGGELFRTDFGLLPTLSVFDRALVARLLGKPIVTIGIGAGGLDAGLSLSVMRFCCRNSAILTREEESMERLAQAGIGIPYASCDLTFHLPPEPHGLPLPAGPRLGISLREPGGTPSCRNMGISRDSYLRGVAALAEHAISRGIRPVFIPFSCASRDDDRKIHAEVRNMLRSPESAVLVEEELPPSKLKALVGDMEYVAGMRLHACIFALSRLRPVLALSYDSKVRKQMQHFGLGEFTLELARIDQAPKTLDSLIALPAERLAGMQAILSADIRGFHALAGQIFPRAPGRRAPEELS